MAVIAIATKPAELLAAIKKQIADKRIETWADENNFFTHSPPQWNRKAWFKPSTGPGTLTFFTVPPKGRSVSAEVYAVYHGRLIEMLLAHFDKSFSQANATAMPVTGDITKASN